MEQEIKILLIGGAENTGKSELIRSLVVDFLRNKCKFEIEKVIKDSIINLKHDGNKKLKELNRNEIKSYIDKKNKDYFCVAIKSNVKIIISTASDVEVIIDNFKKYCKENKPYDFIIAPIRDQFFDDKKINDYSYIRNYFIKTMNIDTKDVNTIEVPLAKINRQKDRKKNALKWYKEKIYLIAQKILSQHPFNIK